MTERPLITGAGGFAGSHLLDYLLSRGHRVHAWSNPEGRAPRAPDGRVTWRAVDVLERASLKIALAEVRPSIIFHCAGVADVHGSFRDPARALRVNIVGTQYLLDAVSEAGLGCRVLVTGSALVYRPSSECIDEDHPLAPATPYGVSKLGQEMAASRSPLSVVLTRPFNHAGPRQDPAYVTSAFARQLAAIETGAMEPMLRVGNLDARRDITDVRDVVRAYEVLAVRGRLHHPYNICCGQAYRVGDLLDVLLSMTRKRVRVEMDPSRLRPSDNPVVLGSHARLTQDTGWRPEIPIERTLGDLLDYWRGMLAVRSSHPA